MRSGRFEGELALGKRQALGAVELARPRAVGDEVVDLAVDAGESFIARFGVEASTDFKGAGLVEKRHVAADLIAKPALFAQFEKQSRAGGFS